MVKKTNKTKATVKAAGARNSTVKSSKTTKAKAPAKKTVSRARAEFGRDQGNHSNTNTTNCRSRATSNTRANNRQGR